MFDGMRAIPVGRYRAYDGSVFFAAWAPENKSGIVGRRELAQRLVNR